MAVLKALGDATVEADSDVEVRFICSRQPTVCALGSGLLNEVEITDQSDDVALSDARAGKRRGIGGVVVAGDARWGVGVECLNRRLSDVPADPRARRWRLVLREI